MSQTHRNSVLGTKMLETLKFHRQQKKNAKNTKLVLLASSFYYVLCIVYNVFIIYSVEFSYRIQLLERISIIMSYVQCTMISLYIVYNLVIEFSYQRDFI